MRRRGIDTEATRAGESDASGALVDPIWQTAPFWFKDVAELERSARGERPDLFYSRYGNPTVRDAERKLAALEGADDAALFGSGMAAVTTTLFALLKRGDHVVLTSDGYRRTRAFVTSLLARFGVEHTVVDAADPAAVARALRDTTRVVLTESPSNPYLRVLDLPEVARAKAAFPRCKLLVDATFATPVNQRPLEQGADLVLHSATKYLGGHNDLLAGGVCGSAALVSLVRETRDVLGGVLDPHAAYLLIRGMKTLPLRVARQNETALAIARWLETRPEVATVFYPGLASHPDHAVAERLLDGAGGVVSFVLRADLDPTSRALDACKLATMAPSLGGVETLIEQPALMSYYGLSSEEREAIGIADGLVRLSIGIEGTEDLWADVERGLAGI